MKCACCGYEYKQFGDEPFMKISSSLKERKFNVECMKKEYGGWHTRKYKEFLYACPKCKTVRIGEDYY